MIKKNNACKICDSKNIKKILKFRNFPLTGIFTKNKNQKANTFNLNLYICNKCSHLQLGSFVSNKILYNKKYANKTSASHLSKQAFSFLKKFIFKNTKSRKLGNILEIGCNDMTMLNKFSKYSKSAVGIDPIWKGKKGFKKGKVSVVGKYIEEVDFQKDVGFQPDIVISTHNLEHIEDPKKILSQLVENLKDDAIIFIEVPDASLMIKNLRFDQIFHQHYHYFNLNSLRNLADQIGYEVFHHAINKEFWGGSLLTAIRKKRSQNKLILKKVKNFDRLIISKFSKFDKKCLRLSRKIDSLKSNIYGYGAGQMTPSFSYHLKNNFKNIINIIDDNKYRNNFYYPELKPQIQFSKKHNLNKNNYYLITALDGTKAIKKKLRNNKINKIISAF
jgi:cyclopropane-fatty-acyl-phospholipid synthase